MHTYAKIISNGNKLYILIKIKVNLQEGTRRIIFKDSHPFYRLQKINFLELDQMFHIYLICIFCQ